VAQRWEGFNITVGPQVPSPGNAVPLIFNEGLVTGFRIRVPGGHVNRTGIAIFYALNQVVPFKAGQYFIGHRREVDFDTEDFPGGAGWSARVFNTDRHAHTFYCHVAIDEVGAVLEEPLASLVLLPPAGGTLVV
jgi:hypothetical protein